MARDVPGRCLRVRGGRARWLPGLVAAQAAGARIKAVIVGAGPAGDAVAAGLRDGRFAGDITLIGSEPQPPYERPHLSKQYLLGKVTRDRLALRPHTQYRQLEVDLVLGRRVRDLGLEDHRVLLDDGKTIGWDVLGIATGSDARRLPGARAIYLRELPEADRLRALLERGEAIDIIGAGFIGCEVAAVARQKGCEVRVVEALEQPLLRVLGQEMGAYIAGVHRDHGVTMHLGTQPAPSADLIAIGSVPRTELAVQAGLQVEGGIVTDEFGHTSARDVFAAGDVTRFFHPLYAGHIRVEHFQTSQRRGYAVGVAMAGNRDEPPVEVPWFWSDQYDLNLQYAGAGLPWDETAVRGEIGKPPFTVFYLGAGRLLGAAAINDHHTVARARRVMESRASITTAQLEDPNFDLRLAVRALP